VKKLSVILATLLGICLLGGQPVLAYHDLTFEVEEFQFWGSSLVRSSFHNGSSTSTASNLDNPYEFLWTYDPSTQDYYFNLTNGGSMTSIGSLNDNTGHYFSTLEIVVDQEIVTELGDPLFTIFINGTEHSYNTPGTYYETLTIAPLTITGEYWIDANFSGPILSMTLTDVAPVPIPGAVWLFCSGLLGLAGLRSKLPK
jgi:hypothetical protein